jgi:hypothetical protein
MGRMMKTVFASLSIALTLAAQQSTRSPQKEWTAAEDHSNMMEQLAIQALRPGPSGNESAPNHANYEESLANPFPKLPDVLTLKNGQRVTSARIWRERRRPEITAQAPASSDELMMTLPQAFVRIALAASRSKEPSAAQCERFNKLSIISPIPAGRFPI